MHDSVWRADRYRTGRSGSESSRQRDLGSRRDELNRRSCQHTIALGYHIPPHRPLPVSKFRAVMNLPESTQTHFQYRLLVFTPLGNVPAIPVAADTATTGAASDISTSASTAAPQACVHLLEQDIMLSEVGSCSLPPSLPKCTLLAVFKYIGTKERPQSPFLVLLSGVL